MDGCWEGGKNNVIVTDVRRGGENMTRNVNNYDQRDEKSGE